MYISRRAVAVLLIAAFAVIGTLGGSLLRLQLAHEDLLMRKAVPPVVFRQVNLSETFLSASLADSSDGDEFAASKKALISGKEDFVEVDLKRMTVSLYREGAVFETVAILSKGREGSWWETPTGRYAVLGKAETGYSSIGNVWMPWSVQFYGNFLIHGWPYYPDGKPVPKGYSGGCIRLSSEDAEKVFRFVKIGTPVLVFDEEPAPAALPLLALAEAVPVPTVTASSAIIADLDTGDILLDKRTDDALPVASLTKLMTTVVASEIIYLGRSVTISPDMLTDSVQSVPLVAGERYRLFDLLYPALLRSSNGAARALRGFFSEARFVGEMNRKAKALGMTETAFYDLPGVDARNVSTLRDMAKLAKYILEKRYFLFDISRGKEYAVFEDNAFLGLAGVNEFSEDARLIGSKNGQSVPALQTLLTVWELRDETGRKRHIMIAILGSMDRKGDGERLLRWLEEGFGVE